MYTPPKNFSLPIDAVLLTGGRIKNLSEPQDSGKGHILINSKPMASYTLDALRKSKHIRNIIMVSEIPQEDLNPEFWKGIYKTAPAGKSVIDSVKSGIDLLPESNEPILMAAGDLPLLTPEAADSFIEGCAEKPEKAVWYGILEKQQSLKQFPDVRHTWAPLKDGTFCGGGLSCIRRDAFNLLFDSMNKLAAHRKNPLILAKILGFKILFNFLIRRLTISMIEEQAFQVSRIPCCGVISKFAETAYNVDDTESLKNTRQRLTSK